MLVCYLLLKLTYCFSDDFLIFVGYFMSCFLWVFFHIKTHTRKFNIYIIFIDFIYHCFLFRFFEAIIDIVKTIPNHQGINRGKWIVFVYYLWFQQTCCISVDIQIIGAKKVKLILSFVSYYYNEHFVSFLILWCWWIIFYITFSPYVFI